jgi:predicted metal-dependent phosphoesterase TrpH
VTQHSPLSTQYSPVDLHLHTTASDGWYAPAEIVAVAAERGVRVIALTDHDSVGGIDEAQAAAADRGGTPEVIPGVEINTDVPQGEAHVLGYFLDHRDPTLLERLAERRAARLDRGRAIVDKLRALGLDVSWERVQEIAGAATGGAVGRPHVAQALKEKGYVVSTQDAFDKYLGRDGPAYVPYARFDPEEAVRVVAAAGGIPVLAHPTTLPDYRERLPGLVAAGLQGLECYYGSYTREDVHELVLVARRFGLVPTGGSDFHGESSSFTAPLGGTPVPLSVVDELKARRTPPRERR